MKERTSQNSQKQLGLFCAMILILSNQIRVVDLQELKTKIVFKSTENYCSLSFLRQLLGRFLFELNVVEILDQNLKQYFDETTKATFLNIKSGDL